MSKSPKSVISLLIVRRVLLLLLAVEPNQLGSYQEPNMYKASFKYFTYILIFLTDPKIDIAIILLC